MYNFDILLNFHLHHGSVRLVPESTVSTSHPPIHPIITTTMSNSRRHSSDGPTESSPLLGRGAPHAKIPKVHSNRTIVNLLLLVNLMVSSAGGLVSIPQARLAEDVLCHEYYHQMASLDVPIDEDLCKLEPIQSELAVILAVSGTFAAVTGFVSAYPWSLLADRYVYLTPSQCHHMHPPGRDRYKSFTSLPNPLHQK